MNNRFFAEILREKISGFRKDKRGDNTPFRLKSFQGLVGIVRTIESECGGAIQASDLGHSPKVENHGVLEGNRIVHDKSQTGYQQGAPADEHNNGGELFLDRGSAVEFHGSLAPLAYRSLTISAKRRSRELIFSPAR